MIVILGAVIVVISIGRYIAFNVNEELYDPEKIIIEFGIIRKNMFSSFKKNGIMPESVADIDELDINRIKYSYKFDIGGKFLVLKINDEEVVDKVLKEMNKTSYYKKPYLFLGLYGEKTKKNKPIIEIHILPENITTNSIIKYSYKEISGGNYDIEEVEWEGNEETYPISGEYKVALKIKNSKGIWSEKVEKIIFVEELAGIKSITSSKEILFIIYENGKVRYKAFGANKLDLLEKDGFEKYSDIQNVDSISMSYKHALIKTKNLIVKSAGSNKFGELAQNSRIDNLSFSEIWGLKDIIKVETGCSYSGVLTAGNKLYLWGINDSKQVNFTRTLYYDMPQKFTYFEEVKDFSLGRNHCLIKDSLDKLYSFGGNEFGQLGNGFVERIDEIQMALDFEINVFHAGDEFSFAVDKEGNLYGWGKNNRYQLGMFGARVKKPCIINSVKNIIRIISSENIVAAITNNGKVFTWGTYYKLGMNIDVVKPIEIPFEKELKSITIVNNEIYVLTNDDELYVSNYNFEFEKVEINN